MKKFLAILMLSFLVGFAIQSCTNDDTDEFIEAKTSADSDITPPEIKPPPGG